MATQAQYNKIIHDWIVLLTGLNGSNVRPMRYRYGFSLVQANGQPIAFDGMIAMFYIGFQRDNKTNVYVSSIEANTLREASVSIVFVGEEADDYASQFQSLCMANNSLDYLRQNGFAIQGRPSTREIDRNYANKYFYRREVIVTLNSTKNYQIPNASDYNDIAEAPINIKN